MERGDRVAIVSHNSARLLIALFAVSGYSRVVVPINFRLNSDEVAYIVEQSGAAVLLVDPELDEALADVTAPHRFTLGRSSDKILFRFDREPIAWEGASEDDVASINYTSGTTARPKGVELTHRNLYINALTFGWQTGVDDPDVYLWAVPMFHCNGWGMVYAVTASRQRRCSRSTAAAPSGTPSPPDRHREGAEVQALGDLLARLRAPRQLIGGWRPGCSVARSPRSSIPRHIGGTVRRGACRTGASLDQRCGSAMPPPPWARRSGSA